MTMTLCQVGEVSTVDIHAGVRRHFNLPVLEFTSQLVDYGHEWRKEQLMHRPK